MTEEEARQYWAYAPQALWDACDYIAVERFGGDPLNRDNPEDLMWAYAYVCDGCGISG